MAKKPYIFVIFSGGVRTPVPPPPLDQPMHFKGYFISFQMAFAILREILIRQYNDSMLRDRPDYEKYILFRKSQATSDTDADFNSADIEYRPLVQAPCNA